MKKLVLVLLSLAMGQVYATGVNSSLTLINDITEKGILSIQASHENCVANFYGHYTLGGPITEKSWVTLNATTVDFNVCEAKAASWNYDLYYQKPGETTSVYIASISPSVTSTGTQWQMTYPANAWVRIEQVNGEPLFKLCPLQGSC